MIRRKLTKSLKEKIRTNYRNLKQADFDGEALTYLKKVRGAAKGRNAKKKKKSPPKESKPHAIKIGDTVIEPDSKAYEIIALSAKNKNQSLKKFVHENKKAIEELLRDYLVFFKTEIDTLIKTIRSLPKGAKIFVPIRGQEKSRPRAIFLLHSIKKAMLELAPIYEVVFIEAAYDLYGNLHFNCPQPGEYKHIGDEDNDSDYDEILDFIDNEYPSITYIRND